MKNFSGTHEFPGIGRKTILVSGRRMEDVIGLRAPLMLLTIEDVTENMDMMDTLLTSEERFRFCSTWVFSPFITVTPPVLFRISTV